MANLYIHIGLHKTATTLIQRTMTSNRPRLGHSGLYYPNFNIIRRRRHYCHHEIARSLIGVGSLSSSELKEYFVKVGRNTKRDCFISSEIFYRGEADSSSPNDFLGRLSELIAFSKLNPIIVICVREQASYLDSLYKEHIEQTKYSSSIKAFYKKRKQWLDYYERIESWRKFFGDVRVVVYESLPSSDFVSEFLFMAVRRRFKLEAVGSSNVSQPAEYIQVKRLLNQTDIGINELKELNLLMETELGASDFKKKSFVDDGLGRHLFRSYKDSNNRLSGAFLDFDIYDYFKRYDYVHTLSGPVNHSLLKRALSMYEHR